MLAPTPDADLNAVLHDLVHSARDILGADFVGAYLQGSLAMGGWDEHSDVDWDIAVRREPDASQLQALQAMHARLYGLPSHWARHLEGSYFPLHLLKQADPRRTPLWFLDNTASQLVRSDHDNTLVVRWVLREHGIALAGPPAALLIDPVPADALRQEVRATMREWGQALLDDTHKMDNRWYQPFAVISYCRMLHTLDTGRIESKPAGVRWALGALDARWAGLIERAWAERPDPSARVREKADPADLLSTRDFIRHAWELAGA
jgi:hypothetical protein